MRILVTGASGFVGRTCVSHLREAGHRVDTTDRTGRVDHAGDLAEPGFVQALPHVDAVLHCAAVQYVSSDLPFGPRRAWFHRNNVTASRNLCMRYAGSGVHFVLIGTSMMYRQSNRPIYGVGSPMQGQGVYSRSKLAAWQYARATFPEGAAIMPCIIGGVGREGLFRAFVKSIGQSGRAVIPGPGTHPVHLVHVEDVAALARLVVERRAAGTYNAAAPGPLTIRDWVLLIADELRVPAPRFLHLPLAPVWLASAATGYRLLAREQLLMLRQPHVLDTQESDAIGWTPRYSNERIVRDIARHIATSTSTVGR